ncbi:MAG TPA: hypothetical protein RMH99_20815 [Sandaracinaceae bacterium LLY-WYZ-13_1]|nr:hypothetical protein [Sandaracinaceae bacterium LLY-WYZ-13_1]
MSTSVSSDTRAKTAKQLRRMRARKLLARLGLGVGVPTLLAVLYYGVFLTPRYESVTAFTIESAESNVPTSALQMLVSSVPGASGRDVMLVQEYVRSRDMLQHLMREHDYVEHYASSDADWVSRLDPNAPFEDVYEYYLDHIEVVHDSQSGVLTLHVQAFDAETAHTLGEAILTESERMVNQLSDSAREDRLAVSQRELERAERRLSEARQALRELQTERGDLNPQATAQAALEVRSRLEGELAIARAELSTVTATAPRGAPEITAARRRVSALQQQIDAQSERLASAEGDESLHAELAEFEPVVIEKEFAQRAYESALTSLELARVDASRQHRYVVRIAGPSQPDDPTHPRFWYSILTVLVLAFAILGVGTLLIASIREHANV